MFSARFYRDDHGDWVLFCPEWSVELPLVEPQDLIDAAMITNWLPCGCGFFPCSHKTQQKVLKEAIDVLIKTKDREFPIPWGAPWIEQVLDIVSSTHSE
jgi:hypothetical protein